MGLTGSVGVVTLLALIFFESGMFVCFFVNVLMANSALAVGLSFEEIGGIAGVGIVALQALSL